MTVIPTEPIGSIPRPSRLIEAIAAADGDDPALDALYEEAIRDTKYAHRPVKQAVISPSALAGERDPTHVVNIIHDHLKPGRGIFIGVVPPIDPLVETPGGVRDRILEAVKYIPVEQLGSCDDCGISPFCDDTTTSGETDFEKMQARVQGTQMASEILGAK